MSDPKIYGDGGTSNTYDSSTDTLTQVQNKGDHADIVNHIEHSSDDMHVIHHVDSDGNVSDSEFGN